MATLDVVFHTQKIFDYLLSLMTIILKKKSLALLSYVPIEIGFKSQDSSFSSFVYYCCLLKNWSFEPRALIVIGLC